MDLWGISSNGRAFALHAKGYEFESRILHQINTWRYPARRRGKTLKPLNRSNFRTFSASVFLVSIMAELPMFEHGVSEGN